MKTIRTEFAVRTYNDWMELHSYDDMPSEIHLGGNWAWHKAGELHREGDKPAVMRPNGYTAYYLNGGLHRDDGPAVIHPSGDTEYHMHGCFLERVCAPGSELEFSVEAFDADIGG